MYLDSPETQVQVLDTFNRVATRYEISTADLIAWNEQAARVLEQLAAACRAALTQFLAWWEEHILKPLGRTLQDLTQSIIDLAEQLQVLVSERPERPFPTGRASYKPHILPIHIPDPVRAGRSPIWSRR